MALELNQEGFKLTAVLAQVGIPESTYHYHVQQMDKEDPDAALKERIKELFYMHNETYGYRRIYLAVRNKNCLINHKKVQRIMQELGLKCRKFSRKTRKYNSYKGTTGKVAKNRLNRRFYTPIPLQKLVTDVSEMKCLDKKLYISPMVDLCQKEVVSYNISDSPTVDFVMAPLEEALQIVKKHGKFRCTVHTDQGFQYQHKRWIQTLKKNNVFQSMSRKGTCPDNAAMESFFGIMKQEIYYGEPLVVYEELKQRIEDYIDYYNHERIKENLGGLSPVQYRIQNNLRVA